MARRKRPAQIEKEDNRQIAIYTRKSKVTHKGDSIGTQREECIKFATDRLKLPEDQEFLFYEDLGKSGFFADRPDFKRLLNDIAQQRIKIVVAYRLDRLSRRIIDTKQFMEFLKENNVDLLVSSDNINTQVDGIDMRIDMMGMMAEWERQILTERITDNLAELAKTGRFMGGTPALGFVAVRESIGSGKKRNSYTILKSVPEEKKAIQRIYQLFFESRSYGKVVTKINEEGYRTKKGKHFKVVAIKDILSNPRYACADNEMYHYLYDQDANIFGEECEFDGKHGLSVYNRTEQIKIVDKESTFLNPIVKSEMYARDISEWIVSIANHEGFISGKQWIETQKLMEKIGDKYDRPHRKTNALLSGIIYCPLCGKKLNVIPESNRFTNGKPRFKYSCPNAIRNGDCSYQAVRGVELDEYIVDWLSNMNDEESGQHIAMLDKQIQKALSLSSSEAEIKRLKKEIDSLDEAIHSQVIALRTANDTSRKFLLADMDEMAERLDQKKKSLYNLENNTANDKMLAHKYEEVKQAVLNFREYANAETPETIMSYIQMVLDRVYVTYDEDGMNVRAFIRGTYEGAYSEVFQPASNLKSSVAGVCDLDDYCELHSYLCRNSAAKLLQ